MNATSTRPIANVVRAVALSAGVLACASTVRASTLYVDDVGDGLAGAGTTADPFRELQTAIDAAGDGDVVMLMPGRYEATPADYDEPLCGNCEEHATLVHATRGFYVLGKSVSIVGSGADQTTLVTSAGYGVLFEGCREAALLDVTVTGGERDCDGAATDAAVVVRTSHVTVSGCSLAGNDDRCENEDVVVGIGGIMGREGAEIVVTGNRIVGNGWDGVALYRGAVALIADNTIEDGRGAGIGITWDSAAIVSGNRISGYWKGIGTFGSSRAVLRGNEVFDNLGWGLVATGTSAMEAANNVVTRNGNCGVALWSDDASMVLVNNIITDNGRRDEWVCPPVGLWMNGDPTRLAARYNDIWGNAEGDYRDMTPLTGTDGNISLDPVFADTVDFRLGVGSPCIDAGSPEITDRDGGRSDMGAWGGLSGRK